MREHPGASAPCPRMAGCMATVLQPCQRRPLEDTGHGPVALVTIPSALQPGATTSACRRAWRPAGTCRDVSGIGISSPSSGRDRGRLRPSVLHACRPEGWTRGKRHDLVRVPDGAEPVRDDQTGAAARIRRSTGFPDPGHSHGSGGVGDGGGPDPGGSPPAMSLASSSVSSSGSLASSAGFGSSVTGGLLSRHTCLDFVQHEGTSRGIGPLSQDGRLHGIRPAAVPAASP